jgi:hypothetical protein
MILLGIRPIGPNRFEASIRHESVVHELVIDTIEYEGGIRCHRLIQASREAQILLHNTGYSKLFSMAFWRFVDGEAFNFPLDLDAPLPKRAKTKRAK